MPLVQSIFNKTMLDMGREVSNHRKIPWTYHYGIFLIAVQCVSIFPTHEPTCTILSRSKG